MLYFEVFGQLPTCFLPPIAGFGGSPCITANGYLGGRVPDVWRVGEGATIVKASEPRMYGRAVWRKAVIKQEPYGLIQRSAAPIKLDSSVLDSEGKYGNDLVLLNANTPWPLSLVVVDRKSARAINEMDAMNPNLLVASALLVVPALYLFVFPKRTGNPNLKDDKHQPLDGGRPRPATLRSTLSELRIFLPFLLPKDRGVQRKLIYWYSLVGVCLAIDRVVKLISPMLLRRIVDTLISAEPTTRLPWVEIFLFVLFRKIGTKVIGRVSRSYRRRALDELTDTISMTLYNKLLVQSSEYHESKEMGTVWRTVCDSGASTVYYFSHVTVNQLPVILDIALGIGACWKIFDGRMALAMVTIIVLYVGFSARIPPWNKEMLEEVIRLNQEASNIGLDTINNWQTVSYFNRTQHERSRYGKAVKASRESNIRFMRPVRSGDIIRQLVASIGVGAVCLLGCWQIQHSSRSAGDFVLLFQFWDDLFTPLDFLVNLLPSTERYLAESQKFIEILQLEPKVKDKEGATEFRLGNGSIEFDNVSFSYDGKRDAVKNVSFKAEGGKSIAIVGETGGGKSTLFKLLCRAYDVTGGSIKIDGQDLRDVTLESFRKHVSIVPQAIGVFNTTILDNLRYANLEATREEVEDACRAAALHKRILDFPNGYEEKVGEKGAKLSGGELQRMAIARALLRKSQIVLFDEATSNLDAETESRIQEYLRKWYTGRTVVVVAHRLATIANADLIISFKDGAIVEAGRHDELLAKRGYFHLLWEKQRLAWNPPKEGGEGRSLLASS